MKLSRMRLENFRQFQGEQLIEFASDPTKNVTLIWGANGAGKTTLLNAFTWVLYGQFTKDFEQTDLLYNLLDWNAVPEGGRSTVSVELEFDHEDQHYTLLRQSTFRKNSDGSASVDTDAEATLNFTDRNGRNQSVRNPDDHIKQILPERLHGFFFFNGERIEHLIDPSAYEDIKDAIKTILGLTVVERAIKHLPKAAKAFEDELRKFGTDEERELTQQLDQIDAELLSSQEELEQAKRNAAGLQEDIEAIDKRLRGSEKARDLQRERDDLVKQDGELTKQTENISERIDLLIRDRGFLSAGLGLFEGTREEFREKRERKELPAPLKRDFIDDLLGSYECICGSSLAEGTPERSKILAWQGKAGLAEVEQRWNELYGCAQHYMHLRGDLGNELQQLIDDQTRTLEQRRGVRERLSEVSSHLKDGPSDEIRELENSRESLERKVQEEIRRQGRLESDIQRSTSTRADLDGKLRRAASGVAKAELARRRLAATREALQTLEKMYEIRTEEVRSELDRHIKSTYATITFKDYEPEVNDDFQLDLLQRTTREPVAKSTGENQILSLSFVGALAALARERYEETTRSSAAVAGPRGGIFPIVMDAAFGSLDENYRRDVAMLLPRLAEQTIVLVSKSQGMGPVVDELNSRVGASYVIHFRTAKPNVPVETIMLDASEYAYVDGSSDGSEYAELLEVR